MGEAAKSWSLPGAMIPKKISPKDKKFNFKRMRVTAVSGNLYKRLGVSNDADYSEIRKAYRNLARKHHPDVSKARSSEKTFMEIKEAYELLSDTARRSEYDKLLLQQSFEDLMQQRGRQRKGDSSEQSYAQNPSSWNSPQGYYEADSTQKRSRSRYQTSYSKARYGGKESYQYSYSQEWNSSKSSTQKARKSKKPASWVPVFEDMVQEWGKLSLASTLFVAWTSMALYRAYTPMHATVFLSSLLLCLRKPAAGYKLAAMVSLCLSGTQGLWVAAGATAFSTFIGNSFHRCMALISIGFWLRSKLKVSLLVPIPIIIFTALNLFDLVDL